MSAHAEVEDQIERLRNGNTLPENEVKALCEKVRRSIKTRAPASPSPHPFVFIESTWHCSGVECLYYLQTDWKRVTEAFFSEDVVVKMQSVSCTYGFLSLTLSFS